MTLTRSRLKKIKRSKLIKKVNNVWHNNVATRYSGHRPAPDNALDGAKKKFL